MRSIRFPECLAAILLALALAGSGCAPAGPLLSFRTRDGLGLVGDLTPPEARAAASEGGRRAPLVVLGHQLGRDRRSWDPLVPRLTAAGYAVLAIDHRGFGASTLDVASPAELSPIQRDDLYLDYLAAIEAASDRSFVDSTRVVLLGAGLSTGAAVRAASENPNVRAVIAFAGLIPIPEEAWLIEHPEFPLLLLVASGDERGTALARQYAARITGPDQRYVELEPPDRSVADDWLGADGLRDDTGLADVILWFLRDVVPASPTAGDPNGR
jgi:pimeloyl-ACP methyl ester carboxylesterase